MLCDSAEPRCSGPLTDECEKYPNCSGSPKEAPGSNGLGASLFWEFCIAVVMWQQPSF